MSPSTKIRLGTTSPATQPSTRETLAQLSRIAARAAAKNIDILLLPEAYIGGYPRGSSFGCAIGSRTAEGRDEFLQYFNNAVDLGDTVGEGAGAGQAWVRREIPGDAGVASNGVDGSDKAIRGDGTTEELERIAKETGVFLVVGCIEKAGGSLYCAVVYVCPKLGIIGKRRKVMPTGTERLIWAQGSPATLRAVTTTIRGVRVNLAAAICWENYMPLLRQALYAQNINLWLAPTADGRDAWLSLMRTVGVEGRCFVVSSNMCVRGGGESTPTATAAATAFTDGHDEYGYEDDAGDHNGYNGFTTAATTAGVSARQRRDSALTEDGFEIALPGAKALRKTRSRRKSVFDDDGNEIVLCCDDDDNVIAEEGGDGDEGAVTSGDVSPRQVPEPVAKPVVTTATATNGVAKQKKEAEFVSRGGSCIVSPFGDVLAGPQWEDDEGIEVADVDFDDCIRGRLDLDAGGSYSRNDSFKLSVQGLDLSPLPY